MNRVDFRRSVLAAFSLAAASVCSATAQDTISVQADQATLMRLPERASTIVIGNPLIADVTLQSNGLLVVTGKGYGSTNLIALDRDGAVLLERMIDVVGTSDQVVVVYRGATARETYTCNPRCEPRATLGDSPDHFNATIGQATARAAQASSASSRPAAAAR
jgi:hypothetical protein